MVKMDYTKRQLLKEEKNNKILNGIIAKIASALFIVIMAFYQIFMGFDGYFGINSYKTMLLWISVSVCVLAIMFMFICVKEKFNMDNYYIENEPHRKITIAEWSVFYRLGGYKSKTTSYNKNTEREINFSLNKLKTLSAAERNKNAAEIAECVAYIHSFDFDFCDLPLRDAQWAIDLVREKKVDCEGKSDMLSALEFMKTIERYRSDGTLRLKERKFMAWDVGNSNWQNECKSGHIGNCAWDIAAIMHHASDVSFTDAFLDGYIRCGGKKLTLVELHSNLYFAQVAEAAKAGNFEGATKKAKQIMGQNHFFDTDLISHETILRLGISGL